ncbi:MAG: SO_0444 family Cu/Zn efflux transporter [Acetobacteraceae bacterium]|nr:SO_0444 family Cu/Zn efflux transporter [Acetobacteraceae bacterium]
MTDFLLQVLIETWTILKEASIFLLLGFLLAGVLAVLVPRMALVRFLGTGRIKSVLWGAGLGAPLPLCSCGVLPMALGLRRQGATDGATVAFLVATPETGVDSISLSYAVADPLMAVYRPLAGIVTGVAAGLATNLVSPRSGQSREEVSAHNYAVEDGFALHVHDHDHHHHGPEESHGHCDGCGPTMQDRARPVIAFPDLAKQIYHHAFGELFGETSYWLMLGFVLSGLVAAAVPGDFFSHYLSGGVTSMLAMLLLSVPVYTCASSSTPLAAAMVLKGLNPGAALVFLLAGPATNLSSLVVLLRFLGPRLVAVYLAAVGVVSLLAGFMLDWVYGHWGLDARTTFGTAAALVPESIKVGGAILFLALVGRSARQVGIPPEWSWVGDRIATLTGVRPSARRLGAGAVAVCFGLYLGSGFFTVQPGEIGIRLRFGEIVTPVLPPGLHYRLPWPFGAERIIQANIVRRMEFGMPVNRTGRDTNIGREHLTAGGNAVPEPVNVTGTRFQKESATDSSSLLTGDANLIAIRSVVQYRVSDPLDFAFSVEDPDALVHSATLAALRGVVGTTGIDAIYTSARSAVEERVARTVQGILDRSRAGVAIVSFRLEYVHPPDEVHDAFRDVASAQEDKLRTINRASTFAVETVAQSKGEADAMIEQALAFKDQQIRRAEADAAASQVRLRAYLREPELTQFRLQLETTETALRGVAKVITPGAAEVKDLDLWLLKPPGASGSK